MLKVPFRIALASSTFLALTSSAFALDGADLLAKINAKYAENGISFAAANVAVDGADVTMTGVTVKTTAADAKPVTIGDVAFTGVETDDAGNYTVDEIKFPDLNVTQDKTTVTATGLSLSGAYIPADAADKSIDSFSPFESANSGPIKVSEDGKEVFSVASMEANSTVREDESGIDYDFAVSGINADLSTTPDPKARDAIEKLGLQTLQGDISTKGSWDVAKGTMAAEAITFDFKNVGKLSLAYSISGLTPDLIKQLQEATKQLNASADKQAADQALGLQMMGLMQQLTFDSAQIRFEDGSITRKALDYAGQQQGVTGDQLAQSLKAMVPLMIGQLNMPDLQNAISTAAATYLDNPKSLTVSAKPAAPVAFPMIMGAAMGAPNTIPQVLGVKVTAND